MAKKISLLSRQAHPWHGLQPFTEDEKFVNVFVEMLPYDTVKYEIDKKSGFLKIDRPHSYSSLCPNVYGFIPRTVCGDHVAETLENPPAGIGGDEDPLDICVFTEKNLRTNGILLAARPIGVIRLLDKGQVDDKILAVLKDDLGFGHFRDIGDIPPKMLDLLKHYFVTYKHPPGAEKGAIQLLEIGNRIMAEKIISASVRDYDDRYLPLF